MTKLLLAASVLALCAGSATAQDSVYDWSGGYVGVQAGYGWGNSTGGVYIRSPSAPYGTAGFDPDGFLGGLYAGYNHQFGDNVIFGAEADLNYARLTADVDSFRYENGDPVPSGNSARAEMTWNGSVRIRAGYAFDRFLPYIAGGMAFGRYEFTPTYLVTGPLPGAKTQTGWTIGAGVDYAVTDNLIARVEYRYTDYGDARYDIPGFPGEETRVDLKTHDVRIGIAYKF